MSCVCFTFINLRFETVFFLYIIYLYLFLQEFFLCGGEAILDGTVDKGLLHG